MPSIWKNTLCLLGLSMSLGLVGGACATSPAEPSTDETTADLDAVDAEATDDDVAHPADPTDDTTVTRGPGQRARCIRRCEDRFHTCFRMGRHRAHCERERQRCMATCRF